MSHPTDRRPEKVDNGVSQASTRPQTQQMHYDQRLQHGVGFPAQLNVAPLNTTSMTGSQRPPIAAPQYPPGYIGTHVRTEQSKRDLEVATAARDLHAFKRRKAIYKLPEPSKRSDILPQSKLFAQLQDAERRVDNEIRRRRNEILEVYGVTKPLTEEQLSLIGAARRVVRVYVFGQRDPVEDTWSLTIHGKVLFMESAANGMHPGGGGSTAHDLHTKYVMFTQCLKSLRIELEGGDSGNDTETILWEKCKQERDPGHQKNEKHSRFQVRRRGNCPKRVKMTFDVDHVKSMFSVPEKLEQLLGLPSGLGRGVYSIPYIMGHVWNHAKKNKLLVQVGDVGKMKLDDLLTEVVKMSYAAQGKVFHAEEDQYMSYGAFSKCLARLLTPSEPFTVEYSMENPDRYQPLCFDFHYESPLIMGSQPMQPPSLVEAKGAHHAELDELDVDLAELYHKFCETEAAHAILQSFANDPHRTLREILAMHNKDPRVGPGQVTRGNEDAIEIVSQSAPYRDPWVDDAIQMYLGTAKADIQAIKMREKAAQQQQQQQQHPSTKDDLRSPPL